MTAIIALCHFCEFHGPSVVMLTQAYRDPPPQRRVTRGSQVSSAVPEMTSFADFKKRPNKGTENVTVQPKICASEAAANVGTANEKKRTQQSLSGCSDGGRLAVGDTDTGVYRRLENLLSPKTLTEGCEGCWSLSSWEDAIVSNDVARRRSFVSSQSCLNPELKSLVRHACIRSISCEVSNTREDPVMFSDSSIATVLSHSFFLKDSKARGFQRYYSLVLISKERQHLIYSWHKVIKGFSEIIKPLQDKADTKYSSEIGEVLEKTNMLEQMTSGCVTKENYYRRRGSSKPARNLRDITMDPNIFISIHQKFVTILSQLEKSLSESVLTGQPMKSSAVEKTKMDTLIEIVEQIGVTNFKSLAFSLLSGKLIKVRSSAKGFAQKAGQSLYSLLPKSLQTSRTPGFANLIFINGQVGEVKEPLLNVIPSNNTTLYTFTPGVEQTSQVFQQMPSSVTRMSRILTNKSLPVSVKETSLRTLSEQLLSQARLFSCISDTQDRKRFLTKVGCTPGDEEILKFFAMYS